MEGARCAERASCGPIRSACSIASLRPTISTRASRRSRATISIASSTGARRSRSSATAPGRSRTPSTPPPCTRRRNSSSAITTSPPSARSECQAASPVKTLDRLAVARERRGDQDRGRRALLPAQSGALDGRLAQARRRRQMDGARPEGGARCPHARRLRPRRAPLRPLPRPGRLLTRALPLGIAASPLPRGEVEVRRARRCTCFETRARGETPRSSSA